MRVFTRARIKLTALYLGIITLITVSFSLGVYSILTHEVERFGRAQRFRIERRTIPMTPDFPPVLPSDPDLVKEVKGRIALSLIAVDVAILLGSGLLAYLLAGRTLNPIKDMVEEQNRFISDASHEFKTPLTALKSSFEVFLREPCPNVKQAKELIKDGIRDVDTINNLATSLLELAQFDKPYYRSNFEVLELDSVISKAIGVIKPLAQQKSLELHFQGSHFKVFGSKDNLVQLFTILLDNAVKYSSASSSVDITTARLDSKLVQVNITDRGIGISPNDLPRIFDRFYRADSSRTKTDVSGYGLGLAIAKNIVDAHNGRIFVDSMLGKGTIVQVNLRIVE